MMEQIKELREKTGAGMVDCKKALEESNGDMEKAIEILRKKGIAKAAKRGERETREGVIKVGLNDSKNTGFVIEFNSETDFVARNEKFQEFTEQVMTLAKTNDICDIDVLLSADLNGSTVKDALDNLSGVIGEKLAIKRIACLKSTGSMSAYSHMGGKIGVLVSIDKVGNETLAYDLAMQIAASDPKYISSDEVPSAEVEKEKEIYKEQLAKEGKPENIMENILKGKINKYYEDICLLNQEFIKDDKLKVKDIIGDAKIEKFIRFSL